MNCLTFCLHTCNVSENTVYKSLSNNFFGGYSKEGFFICTLLYRTRFWYSIFLQLIVFFYQTRIKINSMKVNYWIKVYIGVLNHL
ncbi:hypothetical protein CN387_04970 [Bacillus cereus]|nr:hypothetical protein BK776_15725 [Bacillus thuringiensis serovar aizawai]OXR52859.1 hypothetical protein CCZ40_24865 [Bacillus thuringiensis]PDY58406.1 hypothetical protein COM88_29990 [Bacillus cereus]PEB98799.1 hypothetical protein CON04_11665 [Bacillus cereus]PEC27336.1 hypothetical protein CON75_14195 [Bacillus thuringiensis]